MADAQDWRDTFCGRQAELGRLIAAYEGVAAGRGAHLAVICADRGMGKTRLVQEFYRHLSVEHDPDDYWPDASLFKGNNLRVAPDFSDPHTQAHFAGFSTAERPMPYLWWGFRLGDPLDRNAVRSDIAGHRRTLEPHLERVCFAREHSARCAAAKASVHDVAKDVAIKMGEALMDSVPGTSLGRGLIDVGRGVVRAARLRRQVEQERDAFSQTDLASLDGRRAADLYERTLDDLSDLLEPKGDLGRVPAVVFCDDAQFARDEGDAGALRFLEKLWRRARERNWPVLLVATHWATDWEQDRRAGRPSFAREFQAAADDAAHATIIRLPKQSDLAVLINRSLPGLPRQDVALLLDKADGNPQVLIELVERVKVSPAWRTAQGALSAHGRKKIASHSCNLTVLITERLLSESTPHAVRVALALSSVQGMQFLGALTEASAGVLALGEAGTGLTVAADPLRLITGVQDGVASFVQRAYREAASSLVESQLGDPDEIRLGVLKAALQVIDSGAAWDLLDPAHQRSILGIVATLGSDREEPDLRLQAAKSLLRLVALDPDTASRARHARALTEGMGARWQATQFQWPEIPPVVDALEQWDGPAGSAALLEHVVAGLRPVAVAEPALHGLSLVSALLRLAGCRWGMDRNAEAAELIEEGVLTARALREQVADFSDADFADLLEWAAVEYEYTEVDQARERVAALQAEELSLRRTHFHKDRSLAACEAFVRATDLNAKRLGDSEATALRHETLTSVRLVHAAMSSPADPHAPDQLLAVALLGCLAPIITEGYARFRLPSAEQAKAALPLIEELLKLEGSARTAALDADCLTFCLCVLGAAAASRCGNHPMTERFLRLGDDVAAIDPQALPTDQRRAYWYFAATRALLDKNLESATALAHKGADDAVDAQDWQGLRAASAYVHRLEQHHLLVLVDPDPSQADHMAVIPEVIRAVCADVSRWSSDPATALPALEAIGDLMHDLHKGGQIDRASMAQIVCDARTAFDVSARVKVVVASFMQPTTAYRRTPSAP